MKMTKKLSEGDQVQELIDGLQDATIGVPPLLQWTIIFLAGALPFVESYFGTVLGLVAGLPFVVALSAAVLGNFISMFLLVSFGHNIYSWSKKRTKPSPRHEKFMRRFDQYGVAGVSLLGQAILPSQITSMLMVTAGASKQKVILWQSISIVLWGIAFGALASAGLRLI